MDRFEGMPGYQAVVKLDYCFNSQIIIAALKRYTDKWYVFDELLYQEVKRNRLIDIERNWYVADNREPSRYTIKFCYVTASAAKLADFVRAATSYSSARPTVHINPIRVLPGQFTGK